MRQTGNERGRARPAAQQDRERLVRKLDRRFELPLILLGLVWLGLLVAELVLGESRPLSLAGDVIWGIFIVDFVVRLAVAPRRGTFLRRNGLVALSLAIPAMRVFRFARALRALRAARVIRSLRLVRVVTRLNRGLAALKRVLARRRFGYVMAATAVVTVAGAAGMYAFERDARTFSSFSEALWWTAMLMTTMGSERWPASSEGRVLCLLLATWAFAMFGYITATLATFFVGRDTVGERPAGEVELRKLAQEVAALRRALERREGR